MSRFHNEMSEKLKQIQQILDRALPFLEEGRGRMLLLFLLLGSSLVCLLTPVAAEIAGVSVGDAAPLFYVASAVFIVCFLGGFVLNHKYASLRKRLEQTEANYNEARESLASIRYAEARDRLALLEDTEEKTMTDFLVALEKYCETIADGSTPSPFWCKIYMIEADEFLRPRFFSTKIDPWERDHSLLLGQGGAGQLALQVRASIHDGARDEFPVRLFSKSDLLWQLRPERQKHVKAGAIKTELCAPIFLQSQHPERRGLVELAEEGGPRPFKGVLCFCSGLEPEESSLSNEDKGRMITQAARFAGYLLAKLREEQPGARNATVKAPEAEREGRKVRTRKKAKGSAPKRKKP